MITEDRIKQITRTLLNEIYSEKFVKRLALKFKEQKPDLTDEVIRTYIDRFQQIKNSPKILEKDITKYSWNNLENVILKNQPKRIKTNKIDSNQDLIYNENGLEIRIANSLNACVKYGEGYNFCISSRGNENQFYDYRMDLDRTPYFVLDTERSTDKDKSGKFIDPDHLLVIMALNPERNKNGVFEVTGANNDNVNIMLTWDEIVQRQPKLQNLQHLFKYQLPGHEEQLRKEYQSKLIPLIAKHKVYSIYGFEKDKIRTFTSINKNEYNELYKLLNNSDINSNIKWMPYHKYLEDVYKVMSEYIKQLSLLKSQS